MRAAFPAAAIQMPRFIGLARVLATHGSSPGSWACPASRIAQVYASTYDARHRYGNFFADSPQSIAGCAHLGFQRLSRRETTAGFIGANVAPGDFAQASSRNRFGVDKDGSWLGRTARTRGANDGQRGVGDSSLALSRRRAPFAQMGDSHLNRSPLPKKMFLSC